MTSRYAGTFFKQFVARPAVGPALAFGFWLIPCQSPGFSPEILIYAQFAGSLIAAIATALEMRWRCAFEEAALRQRIRIFLYVLAIGAVIFLSICFSCVVYYDKQGPAVIVPVGLPGHSCCDSPKRVDCIHDELKSYRSEAIEACWGVLPVMFVRLSLVAAYWWMAGASGAWMGLLLLLWTGQIKQPEVPPMKIFDVFLCHNSADKPAVKKIGRQLQKRGILPWLDEWELRPGQPWQPLLEQQIDNIKSAAVFVGSAGVGPWQEQELYGFLSEFVSRQCPVIPVLLPDAPKKPKLPIFLKAMTWVDFRVQDPDPLARLIWGITGKRPERLGE